MRNSTIALISAVISSFTFYFIWKNAQRKSDEDKDLNVESDYDSNSVYNNCCNSPCSFDSTFSGSDESDESDGSNSSIRNRNVEERLDKICEKLEEYLQMENVN